MFKLSSTPFDASRPLAFMHIPKTSGSALTFGLTSALRPSRIVGGFDHCLFGSFKEFDRIDAGLKQHIYASADEIPSNAQLIAGHIGFSTMRQAYPLAQCMTIMREPASRLLSHWLYWRQHSDAALQPWNVWADRVRYARHTLAIFLGSPLVACQTDNVALRMLLWPHPMIPSGDFIDPVYDQCLIDEAIAVCSGFDFIDIIENLDFLKNLESWLGARIPYDRRNETFPDPSIHTKLSAELTTEACDLLDARTRLDRRIWAAIAGRCLDTRQVTSLRESTLLFNVARYAALVA